MGKSKRPTLDKFSRKAIKVQDIRRRELQRANEEPIHYAFRNRQLRNLQKGVTLAELVFVLVFFSGLGLVGYVAFHFLSKVW